MQPEKHIRLRGVRVHNLKNIDVDIPKGKFVAVTGISGSGKSSLVLDTLYAEGQRRYVESFSPYARQFLERMDRPDVDKIENIPPAIAIERKNTVRNRRSTVGTASEVNDYLRLLFARIGEPFCPDCGVLIESHSIGQIVAGAARLPERSRFMVNFPLSLSERLGLDEQIGRLREMGFIRIFHNGAVRDISAGPPAGLPPGADVEVVVDRLVAGDEAAGRLAESAETCYRLGRGRCLLRTDGGEVLEFSKNLACTRCGYSVPELRPQLFSFNSPLGACGNCSGYGSTIDIDPGRVAPDESLSLRQGAVQPWNTEKTEDCYRQLMEGAPDAGIPVDVPWKDLTERQKRMVMEGTRHFSGVMDFFDHLESKKYKLHVRVLLSRYRRYVTCPLCRGSRLSPEAETVRIRGRNIARISAMTIADAHSFFCDEFEPDGTEGKVAGTILEEIRNRLQYLRLIGLGYLTIDRSARTLSGGEMQRLNLAASLGSALTGALYILDEPSVGLHPRDNDRLINIIMRLKRLGNTVLAVEHDLQIVGRADHIIELGPGAGPHGGKLVYSGPSGGIGKSDKSITGAYISGRSRIDVPRQRRRPGGDSIILRGCSLHNLKNIDVEIPLGLFICVTGVSGSGKSTLVQDTLYRAVKSCKPGGYAGKAGAHAALEGADLIKDVVLVSQSPIGRTPRSNPATYIKCYDAIRALFAGTRDARIRNLSPGAFSFNTPGGRCEHCSGAGSVKVDMQFLADIHVTCHRCRGRRFHEDILRIKYKGRSVHDVLDMTAGEAIRFFAGEKRIVRRLSLICSTGLGYLKLGQPANTLSGGESQRLKLARFMTGHRNKQKLMIFDEPTIGLHCSDIEKLLKCFQRLVRDGHTVMVVEHNLDVIKNADYVIDLGPGEGGAGGCLTACGTPEEVAACRESVTGRYLKNVLDARFPA